MKRLFRTSKSTIDPLPPPAPPSAEYEHPQQYSQQPQAQHQQQPPRKSASGLRHDADAGTTSGGALGKGWFGGSSAPSVTPFPADLGHGNPSSGGLLGGPMRRLSRREKKDKGGSAPSMLEIQQLHMSGSPKLSQAPPPPSKSVEPVYGSPLPPPPGHSRFYEPELASPDSSWTVLPPPPGNRQEYTPSPEPYGSRSHTPPLPIPSAPALQGVGSGRSSPTHQQLYLPPGARPPTPPAALRPATPSYATLPGKSQSSLHSQHYEDQAQGRAGRDRGYSSASGSVRGSDIESSLGHSIPSKPAKIAQTQPIRSPLAYASSPLPPAAFPTPQPHPFQMPPGGTGPSPYSPLEDDLKQLAVSDQQPQQAQQQLSGLPPPPAQAGGKDKDKEKKKFWGMDMGWTGRKDRRDKENLEVRDPREQGRRSFDWSQAQDHTMGQPGYTVTHAPPNQLVSEDEQRGRIHGRGRDQRDQQDPANAKDVSAAIQMLCARPDPSFEAVYGVCDRMNHSEASETICKDAARAIRKQFKNGNEPERKAAAVVWLLMMRNVPAVRSHAASKKVLQTLEPILLAPPNKPLVNVHTYKTITDILADLTFNFGHEKGCEALTDAWKKVKLPQESDNGRPLADDHHIFTPEAQYPTHFSQPQMYGYDQSFQPDNERLRQNDDRPPGPGYANLPSHGDDMRRLIEESTAGKEAARVLSEALVYTRPDEMGDKSIIREFYHKCFHAHESLTNQMDWAQAEASQSRERTMHNGISLDGHDERPGNTIEEEALAALFEAHAALSEVIKQHDELERMAMEQREISEVRERSKKDMKMGRDDPSRYDQNKVTGFLSASQTAQGSTSRSPSPANRDRLGSVAQNLPLPAFSSAERSRTPSPDSLQLPPKVSSSPGRPASPRARGGRPLPNPFRGGTASNASLQSSSAGHGSLAVSNPDPARPGASEEEDGDDMPAVPLKPSRKALGKRPAKPIDPDDTFDPNDMFSEKRDTFIERKDDTSSSEESVTADDVFFYKPVVYAYDAYKEKLEREAASGGNSSSSGYRAPVPIVRADGSGGSGAAGMMYGHSSAQVDARA